MKFLKVGLSAALAAMVMLTSCLSEGSTERTVDAYGVIVMEGFTPLFYTDDYSYPIYSSNLSQYASYEDVYTYAYITYDPQDEINAEVETRKHYVGSVQVAENPFDKATLRHNGNLDKEEIYENQIGVSEILVLNYLRKTLILGTGVYKLPKDSKVTYLVEYNAEQEPEIDNTGRRIYDIYIRAILNQEGTSSTTETNAAYQAYVFDYAFTSIVENREKAVDDTYFYLRLNYASEVDHEKGEIKWTTPSGFITTYVAKK